MSPYIFVDAQKRVRTDMKMVFQIILKRLFGISIYIMKTKNPQNRGFLLYVDGGTLTHKPLGQ
ncbi:MAG: hypothetical protein KJ043_14185, partial [Anaerolineae bacterium]|nr:hypothetical protein [Anaerolineae bacterium]